MLAGGHGAVSSQCQAEQGPGCSRQYIGLKAGLRVGANGEPTQEAVRGARACCRASFQFSSSPKIGSRSDFRRPQASTADTLTLRKGGWRFETEMSEKKTAQLGGIDRIRF